MNKISVPVSNHFCPQTLFLYGTYKEDGTPNYGLFCWLSYCWDNNLGIMACIGGEKLTKDRIRTTGVFSANLVSEDMLPLADYCGNTPGYDPNKMNVKADTINGEALNVPILKNSPWSYELKVKQTVSLGDSDIFICSICNIMADEVLTDDTISVIDRLRQAAPVITTHETYLSLNRKDLGKWGQPKKYI